MQATPKSITRMFSNKTNKFISTKNIEYLCVSNLKHDFRNKMADSDNLTAILYKVDDIRLEQVPVPEPAADEVKYQLIR